MKTLILSCNTGEGHNSCAKAIQEYYERQGKVCEIKDGLEFISVSFSRFMSWGHSFVYRHLPWLFNAGYFYTEKHPAVFHEGSAAYKLITRGTEGLYRYIAEGAYDAVICTHVFTALMVTAMQKEYSLKIVTGYVSTDYTCSPSTKDSCLDYYFIPDESFAQEFECRNIPQEKMIASGIPVRQMFYTGHPKTEAKIRAGIRPTQKHLLMMCGSMGCGPMENLLKELVEGQKEDWVITVICGRNEKLKNKLDKKYGQNVNVHIRGFVKDMSLLMDSADLYATKPGGISVSEAAVKELPMVLIDAVAGCEKYNRIYFVNGGGAKTGSKLKELTKSCVAILGDTEILLKMKENLAAMGGNNASQYIYETMKEGVERIGGIQKKEKTEV